MLKSKRVDRNIVEAASSATDSPIENIESDELIKELLPVKHFPSKEKQKRSKVLIISIQIGRGCTIKIPTGSDTPV